MRRTTTLTAVAIVVLLSNLPAVAWDARRHPRAAPAPAASRFYPEEVEGGVKGNLPFNNQIRKHTDPLNANGAR